MEITYKTDKLYNQCENPSFNKELVKSYGIDVANKLPRRILELKAFNSLNDIPTTLPYRRHKLNGKLKDHFAVNINNQYRLIFKPNDSNNVEINLKEIKKIKIMEVSKHYE